MITLFAMCFFPDMLVAHLPSHDNDQGSFMCDLCPDIFTVRRQLKEHVKTHNSQFTHSGDDPPKPCIGLTGTIGCESLDGPQNSSRRADPAYSFVGKKLLATMLGSALTSVSQSESVRVSSPKDLLLPSQIKTENTSPSEQESASGEDAGFVNRTRASVISGMFNVNDDQSPERSALGLGQPSRKKDNSKMTQSQDGGSVSGSTVVSAIRGDRFYEVNEFVNSPDFSSLTEDDNLDLDGGFPSSNVISTFYSKNQSEQKGSNVNTKPATAVGRPILTTIPQPNPAALYSNKAQSGVTKQGQPFQAQTSTSSDNRSGSTALSSGASDRDVFKSGLHVSSLSSIPQPISVWGASNSKSSNQTGVISPGIDSKLSSSSSSRSATTDREKSQSLSQSVLNQPNVSGVLQSKSGFQKTDIFSQSNSSTRTSVQQAAPHQFKTQQLGKPEFLPFAQSYFHGLDPSLQFGLNATQVNVGNRSSENFSSGLMNRSHQGPSDASQS